MRASAVAVLLAGLAGAGASVPCGVAAQDLPAPRRVTRLGFHRAYGPGIVGASIRRVGFEVTRAAHVIVLRVDPSGGIEALVPQRDDQPTERPPGVHMIEAPPPQPVAERMPAQGSARLLDPVLRSPDALERGGRSVFPPAAGSSDSADAATTYYWLVIAADVPTGVDQLRSGLEALRARAFPNVEASVRALPQGLVGKRTKTWAAYYALVQP